MTSPSKFIATTACPIARCFLKDEDCISDLVASPISIGTSPDFKISYPLNVVNGLEVNFCLICQN